MSDRIDDALNEANAMRTGDREEIKLHRPMDDEDRRFFSERFQAIAYRMEELGLTRGNNWQVETTSGRVYQFRCVRSYAKRGSPAAQEEDQMMRRLLGSALEEA